METHKKYIPSSLTSASTMQSPFVTLIAHWQCIHIPPIPNAPFGPVSWKRRAHCSSRNQNGKAAIKGETMRCSWVAWTRNTTKKEATYIVSKPIQTLSPIVIQTQPGTIPNNLYKFWPTIKRHCNMPWSDPKQMSAWPTIKNTRFLLRCYIVIFPLEQAKLKQRTAVSLQGAQAGQVFPISTNRAMEDCSCGWCEPQGGFLCKSVCMFFNYCFRTDGFWHLYLISIFWGSTQR